MEHSSLTFYTSITDSPNPIDFMYSKRGGAWLKKTQRFINRQIFFICGIPPQHGNIILLFNIRAGVFLTKFKDVLCVRCVLSSGAGTVDLYNPHLNRGKLGVLLEELRARELKCPIIHCHDCVLLTNPTDNHNQLRVCTRQWLYSRRRTHQAKTGDFKRLGQRVSTNYPSSHTWCKLH